MQSNPLSSQELNHITSWGNQYNQYHQAISDCQPISLNEVTELVATVQRFEATSSIMHTTKQNFLRRLQEVQEAAAYMCNWSQLISQLSERVDETCRDTLSLIQQALREVSENPPSLVNKRVIDCLSTKLSSLRLLLQEKLKMIGKKAKSLQFRISKDTDNTLKLQKKLNRLLRPYNNSKEGEVIRACMQVRRRS